MTSASLTDSTSSNVLEREIVGNDLDNTFQIQQGQNTIFGNGGNDRFTLLGGVNLVNGGEGIDTVEIGLKKAEAGNISKTGNGNIVNIGNDNTAIDVEYIEYIDVIVDVSTLTAIPVMSFADQAISIAEGDVGSNFATFDFKLSSIATEDVVIDISSYSDFAEAEIDFVEPTAQFTIAAGENSGNFSLEILGDTDIEGDEEVYLDLTIASGATFAGGVTTSTVGVNILDNEVSFITDEDTLITISASRLISDYIDKLYGDYLESDFDIVDVNSANGTAVLNANGDVEFTPATDLNGKLSLELTLTDGTDNYTDLVEVDVIPVNDILLANNDTVVTDEDTPLTIQPIELYGNDIHKDPERSLNISAIDNIVNGSAVISRNGVIQFTPAANFNGTATFDYTVTDGIDQDTASVEVIVNPINDAPVATNDTISTPIDEDTSITILASELLSNDSDVEGSDLSIVDVNSDDGTAILNVDDSIEFTPAANFNGTAGFNYDVSDGTDTSTASVEVSVNPVNDPLIANDDIYTIREDTSVTILASELFSNDINNDIEKSLSISSVDNLVNGTATVNTDGNIEFTPTENFNGTASFDYIVTDGIDVATASVAINVISVNDPPIVNNDTVAIDEDTTATILPADLLINDRDLDGDSLSFVSVNNAVKGSVSVNSEGNIEFVPETNFNGTASFDYTITDNITSTKGLVEINVNAVNDFPTLINSIPDITVTSNSPNSRIKFVDYFDDIEQGNNLAYVYSAYASFQSSSGNDFFKTFAFDSATRELVVGYGDDVIGTATFTVEAIDREDESVEDSFKIFVINSDEQDNSLAGGDGNDYLDGLQGNDSIVGGNGNDTLIGSENNDTLSGEGDNDSLNGGDGEDRLFGNAGDDTLVGGKGNDKIDGGAGNDTIRGNGDDDTIVGGDNDDILWGNGGHDNLDGGDGNDRVFVQSNNNITLTDTSLTGDGTDTLSGIDSANLYGSDSNNLINAINSLNIKTFIQGNGGNDTLRGGALNDGIQGNAGNDVLWGHGGDDKLIGGGGSDRVFVQSDGNITLTDTSLTGDGTDTLSGIEAANLYGSDGANLINASNANNIKTFIQGHSGNDTLRGGALNDGIQGNDGNDTLWGHGGDDKLIGGGGSDRVFVQSDSNITLTDTQITGDGTDTLSGIEAANLYGGDDDNLINASNANNIKTFIQGNDGNDTLRGGALNDGIQGNSGDDTLVGNDGNDHLIGGAGNDFLQGDAGNDTLSGGGGNDVFTLKSAAGADVITDFRDGIDLFRLANSLAFADLGLSDNVAGDAALIRDLSNANQLLATVNGVSATDLTAADFI